jgi:hypothetical protein
LNTAPRIRRGSRAQQQARLVEIETLDAAVGVGVRGEAEPQLRPAAAAPGLDQLLLTQAEGERQVVDQRVAEKVDQILGPPRPPLGDPGERGAVRRTVEAGLGIEAERDAASIVDADLSGVREVVEDGPFRLGPHIHRRRGWELPAQAFPSGHDAAEGGQLQGPAAPIGGGVVAAVTRAGDVEERLSGRQAELSAHALTS